MAKINHAKTPAADLEALSQSLGAQIDDLRAQRVAIADELRSRAASAAEKRAKLQAELDELDGVSVEAEGQTLSASGGVE
jgi:hypothetical protein